MRSGRQATASVGAQPVSRAQIRPSKSLAGRSDAGPSTPRCSRTAAPGSPARTGRPGPSSSPFVRGEGPAGDRGAEGVSRNGEGRERDDACADDDPVPAVAALPEPATIQCSPSPPRGQCCAGARSRGRGRQLRSADRRHCRHPEVERACQCRGAIVSQPLARFFAVVEPSPQRRAYYRPAGALRRPESGRTITMTSSTKRRLAWRIGAALAAAAACGTLGISAASADSGVLPPAGITVPGDTAAVPAVLVASLEGRNEVTGGAPAGQALELFGVQGSTLSYSVPWAGIGTPAEAAIHAGVRGADGPVVVPLFTTPRPAGGFASGTVTVTDPALLAALRTSPGSFYA